VLLLFGDVERVAEFAELVVDERVLGEAILGQPGPVQPVTMEGPLEKARLNDGEDDRDGNDNQN
jgi:hypothetical protein